MNVAVDAMQALVAYSWPGNVRELRNVIERAASLCDTPTITRPDLSLGRIGNVEHVPDVSNMPGPGVGGDAGGAGVVDAALLEPGVTFKEAKQQVLDNFERAYLARLLDRNKGNITRSAHEAGLTRYHLRELLKRHNLSPS